jgi:hypothetical protein
MKKISLIAALMALGSSSAFALGMGQSTYPLLTAKKFLSTEITGVTSDGGGLGVQGRYTYKVNKAVTVDGGFGVAAGERPSRIFAGADYELYPDYMRQPKVSFKGQFESAKEFGQGKTELTIAPTVSKGFVFWGHEAYPYIATPVGFKLNSDDSTYKSTMSVNLGINGNLPFQGYRHLTGTLEAKLGVKNSYTGVVAGVAFPLE